jgi:predicted NBD/HSP70 family sugar kinase
LCIDAHGDTVARARQTISRPTRPAQVAALRTAARRARHDAGLAPRLAVVSAADPVDRTTGRLVHLPEAPFLLGELDPAQILAPQIDGPVTVDNDVNWAARAERDHARAAPLDDFGYLFLGEGLGCAIITDGRVQRGHAGLAGEIAHLITAGPQGQAQRFIEVFSELGLRRTGSTAIDVERLLTAATGPEPRAAATRHALGQAVSGVLAAVVALTDPELIIIGGAWGNCPVILEAIAACTAHLPRTVPVRGAELTDNPSLDGARIDALSRLRSDIITAPRPNRR